MITFLPYANFDAIAKVLDRRRLGQQRREALMILNAVVNKTRLYNHAAAKLWRKHINALVAYGIAICKEWEDQGYEDNLGIVIKGYQIGNGSFDNPGWLGDERLHSSHRARLLAKDPVYYSQFGWKEEPGERYFWPLEAIFG